MKYLYSIEKFLNCVLYKYYKIQELGYQLLDLEL